MTWHYEKNGVQNGPVTVEDLLRLLETRQISRETLVWREGMADWTPLQRAGLLVGESGEELAICAHSGAVMPKSQMVPYGDQWIAPEHRETFVQDLMAGRPAGVSAARADGFVPEDYTVPIGECIGRAWETLTANFWPVVGVNALVFVSYMAMSFLPIVGNFAGLVQMPLFAGLNLYMLHHIRGQRPELGVAFSGFNHFLHLFLLGLISGLIMMVAVAPGAVLAVLGGMGLDKASGDELPGVAITMLSVGAVLVFIPLVYLQTAWMFAVILCIDHKLEFWPSMQISMKAVSKHFFQCLGFSIVLGLLAMVGVIALCLGFFVTMPLTLLAMMHLYEHIFGNRRAADILQS
ncbi:MAG: DUF4339 domain-containing protein [Verrucomicrobiae bacterium]|nr:DUF4339 domain-containing protein [Verrucomicrobiae bacterium]MCP5550152.1 DUF4339 domain-containing protein [Akkermansiaceae bacterium]